MMGSTNDQTWKRTPIQEKSLSSNFSRIDEVLTPIKQAMKDL
jgi:hypothetical protein